MTLSKHTTDKLLKLRTDFEQLEHPKQVIIQNFLKANGFRNALLFFLPKWPDGLEEFSISLIDEIRNAIDTDDWSYFGSQEQQEARDVPIEQEVVVSMPPPVQNYSQDDFLTPLTSALYTRLKETGLGDFDEARVAQVARKEIQRAFHQALAASGKEES